MRMACCLGFRPGFKFYNMWLSLLGALMCIAVMFVISWPMALTTFAVVCALYVYIHHRKPGKFPNRKIMLLSLK